MKRFLWLGALLVATAPLTNAYAYPNGRSAIMAARLEKHADGWLAWYLPDDRYKIAGGVWKYVSTDLDTYYHRPNSPNIFRQSKDHIIGFASAKDAEDAGYLPDPSDGTSSAVSSGSGGDMGELILNPTEAQYKEQMVAMMKSELASYLDSYKQFGAAVAAQNGGASKIDINQFTSQLKTQIVTSVNGLIQRDIADLDKINRVHPPKRFAAFHRASIADQQAEITYYKTALKALQGDTNSKNQMYAAALSYGNTERKLEAEGLKVGIDVKQNARNVLTKLFR